jgi:hypothetical protein
LKRPPYSGRFILPRISCFFCKLDRLVKPPAFLHTGVRPAERE